MSSVVLLVVEPMASIPSLGVMALVDLISLESQGRTCETHLVVGVVVCPSHRAVFGQWVTVPVITAWRCCLVCAAWHGDGVYPD